jgi:hypothetical protein
VIPSNGAEGSAVQSLGYEQEGAGMLTDTVMALAGDTIVAT